MYILSFNLKEQLLLLLQNVYEVKQSTPANFIQNSAHLSGFQMVGLLDFWSHLKSEPFANQPLFEHLKSRLVPISDPHCNWIMELFAGAY